MHFDCFSLGIINKKERKTKGKGILGLKLAQIGSPDINKLKEKMKNSPSRRK